jgi:hypothetical protein
MFGNALSRRLEMVAGEKAIGPASSSLATRSWFRKRGRHALSMTKPGDPSRQDLKC